MNPRQVGPCVVALGLIAGILPRAHAQGVYHNQRLFIVPGPGNERGWFEFINKPFTRMPVPLTRNAKGWITSLKLNDKTHKFDYDDKGNVKNYSLTASY